MNDQVTTRKDNASWITGGGITFQSARDMAEALEATAALLRELDGPLPVPMYMRLHISPHRSAADADDALDRFHAVHRVSAALGLPEPTVSVSKDGATAHLQNGGFGGVLVAELDDRPRPPVIDPAEVADQAATRDLPTAEHSKVRSWTNDDGSRGYECICGDVYDGFGRPLPTTAADRVFGRRRSPGTTQAATGLAEADHAPAEGPRQVAA